MIGLAAPIAFFAFVIMPSLIVGTARVLIARTKYNL